MNEPRLSTVYDEPGWWSRNWKVLVPMLILTPMMASLMCAFGAWWGISGVVRTHDVYREAWPLVRESAEVQSILGRPIEESWAASISLDEQPDGTTDAHLVFNVHGPNGDATAEAIGVLSDNTWKLQFLAVHTRTRLGNDVIELVTLRDP